MELLALALGLRQDFFDASLVRDVSTFSANYYPAQGELSTTERQRVILREHTDSGMLTVLYQTGDYTGLQLYGGEGRWIDIPAIADSFVINIGDLMARWTNGRWRSTLHRVVASQQHNGSRMSVPTFYLPAVDAVVEPLGPGPAQYEPITPYEWEPQYLSRTTSYRG